MKEKKKRGCGILGKTIAFLLLVFGLICMPVGVAGTYTMIKEGYFLSDSGTLKQDMMSKQVSDIGLTILYRYVECSESYANDSAQKFRCYYVIKENGKIVGNYMGAEEEALWSGTFSYNIYEAGIYAFNEIEDYEITVYVLKRVAADKLAWTWFFVRNFELLRILFPVIAVAGLLLAIGCFVFLMCVAGRKKGMEEPDLGLFGKIPTDVFTLLSCLVAAGWFQAVSGWELWEKETVGKEILIGFGCFLLFLNWCMSMAARQKAGTLWKNILCLRLWSGGKRFGKYAGKHLEAFVKKLPLIWKTVCGMVLLSLFELVVLWIISISFTPEHLYGAIMICWIVEKLAIMPVVCVLALHLKSLQNAGCELAAGNLEYQVNTKELFWELKEHGENLNRISKGVNKAVQERIRSEHFKAELITNVSHDIKTPLTSIINYSDLLYNVETDNEKVKEYAEVLYRQSDKLKKLLEDLVEASKASTGSLEVNLQICEVGVLLEQAQGEYEKLLNERKLQVIVKLTEKPVKILADGRHLWRIFDNLFNNICKYAQMGTRVYLSVEEINERAVITFRNISEYPLDIGAQELLERFVRGDKSRHTDGNGLGLNIAQSLAELQKGTLELVIDGDLFKVILTFPKVEE